MSEQQNDPVNSPNHYIAGPYECATVARAVFGDWAWAVHCRITAWTYLWRAGKKGPAREDIAKAARYLARAEDIDDRRSELHRSEFDQMETDLAMARHDEEALKSEIASLRQHVAEMSGRLMAAKNQIGRLQECIAERESQISQLRKPVDELAEAKRNEEALKGEIARLRQQSLELANRLLGSENKARRTEELVSSRDQQIERQVQTIRQIQAEAEQMKRATKKRGAK